MLAGTQYQSVFWTEWVRARYMAFVDTPGAGAAHDGPGIVRDAAAGRIWRAYERLRTHNDLVPFADVPALHALRIESKRLRYTLEFFAEVMKGLKRSNRNTKARLFSSSRSSAPTTALFRRSRTST